MSKSKPPPKDRFSPGHHLGLEHGYGYDVAADGSIRLCPALADPIAAIGDREHALRTLQRNTDAFVAEELARLAKESRAWWERIARELAINPDDRWTVDGRGTLRQAPPAEAKAEAPPP